MRVAEFRETYRAGYDGGAALSRPRIRARCEKPAVLCIGFVEIGGLVGALDGSTIKVEEWGDGLRFVVKNPLVTQQIRTLSRDWAGRAFMHNEIFRTNRTAPKGIGLKSFATQAYHAERFGVAYIETEAVGNYASSRKTIGRWNGYYSWARMGYNAPLDEDDWEKFPMTFRGIRDLNSLMEQENGWLVWLYLGRSKDMVFDLDQDTPSWRILRKYLQKKGFTVEFR